MLQTHSGNINWQDTGSSVGIFGGTFDPVQNAHCAVAEAALKSQVVQSVVFLPNQVNPLKSAHPTASGDQRLEMIRLATEGQKDIAWSELELKRESSEPSYTFHSITEIKKHLRIDQKLFFIMGSDCLARLGSWYQIHDLIKLIGGFIVYPRPGYGAEISVLMKQGFSDEESAKVLAHMLSGQTSEIAANVIRDRIFKGDSIHGLVPKKVEAYIKAHLLYQVGQQ